MDATAWTVIGTGVRHPGGNRRSVLEHAAVTRALQVRTDSQPAAGDS